MRHAPLHAVRPVRAVIGALSLAVLLVASAISESAHAAPTMDGAAMSSIGHFVVSEVMTGGAGASDEFVELYNPSTVPLPLDGLELVYVTASGATITRKAVWGPGAEVEPGGHVLVANEAGLFASIADVTYANGLAATGGSMALRVIGTTPAVDAVGWGTAASTWLEGIPAPAAPAGSSIERLPGGELGSGQDTDSNVVDFIVRATPDPQNSASPPVPPETPTPEPSPSGAPTESLSPSHTAEPSASPSPSATPEPSALSSPSSEPSATPEPSSSPTPLLTPEPTMTPSPTATPSSTPSPTPFTVAHARALPDDTPVLVRGTALTDSAFAEGGGYLADASGGIAVLLDGGSFPRGVELLVSGVVDDRFAQRTVRADSAGLTVLGPGIDLEPLAIDSGAVGEAVEGQLVTISGVVGGSPTALAAGLAYEVDDGSGPIRVLVGPATGIDTAGWVTGTALTVTGVVGQRDSSGTGADGYRVQPRDSADVLAAAPPATPEPTSSAPPSPSASPTPAAAPLLTIAAARASAVGTQVRIRGVVTLPTGLVEAGSAVVADPSGAILVRVGSEVGRLRRGQLVELGGLRSTRSGMVTLRVTQPVTVIGTQAEPVPLRRATGRIREADEAILVVVRGLVPDGPRRTTGGGLTLTVNDGSGALRVFVAAGTGISAGSLPAGSWVELRGVIGQQTTGAAPSTGYRLWPRDRSDVTVIARSTGGGRGSGGGSGNGSTSVRPGVARTVTTPAPSVFVIKPTLGGAAALAPSSTAPVTTADSRRATLPPIQAPLAAGLGGLAGLLVLAWRHGTWGRVWVEAERRVATLRTPADDEVEDESYTLAP